MAVSLPREPCYYYECSDGRFRLTYFIPPSVLRQLIREQRISEDVLDDFPDGVDLDCTEPDFADFHELYDYRPECSPDSLLNTFFAFFSSTRNWRRFRGTGFVPAERIESEIGKVDYAVRKAAPVEEEPSPEPLPLRKRRRRMRRRAARRQRIESSLRNLRVKGVDPRRTLDQQGFSVDMEEGESAHEVFSQLHKRRRKE